MSLSPTILLVDDESTNFEVVEMLLSPAGYDLHYLTHGNQLNPWLKNYQPDVILLDVLMPDISGIELCQQLKQNPQTAHIPTIILTALTDKRHLSECFAAGADDFISKPFHGGELRARVRSMLRIKQQHDRLQTMVSHIQETLELRQDMVNTIVHDLRNPLANISLASQILQMAETTPQQTRKIEQIDYATRRLQNLIDGLLTMAQLEAGKFMLNRTAVDLHQLGQEALADFTPIAHQQNISLEADLPKPGTCMTADAGLLRRVLDNLLSNALKFSPAHTPVMLHLSPEKIQVCDRGSGISPKQLDRIFTKYEIGDIHHGVKQLGLGLAFCKFAVEAHQGHLTVEANHPTGSIFTITL
jgi:two-component system, sensor histidine kinase and response regulator